MEIRIATRAGKITLTAPYNRDLAPKARKIGGRWNSSYRTWDFHARDEQRVRDLAREIYGTDGSDAENNDLVIVQVAAADYISGAAITVAGLPVAKRWGRDEAVKLAKGVVIISGDFASSGGSVKNPAIGQNDAVLEIRDIPRAAACAAGLEIVAVGQKPDPTAAFLAERAQLLARLAEIDAALNPSSDDWHCEDCLAWRDDYDNSPENCIC